MLLQLLRGALALISDLRCPLCGGARDPSLRGGDGGDPGFCAGCRAELALPAGGLRAEVEGLAPPAQPLPWRALAVYDGAFRRVLLHQRQAPAPAVLAELAAALVALLFHEGGSRQRQLLLVPIPSWKRRANPLAAQLSQAMCRHPSVILLPLLERSRPTVGQHHLGRDLRLRNQCGSFRLAPAGRAVLPRWRRQPLWLLDDILTTGATAQAAAQALEAEGLEVAGLACLARTPERRLGNVVPYYPGVAKATGRDSSVGRAGD